MNAAHVHLILNHFPIAGMLFSIPLLAAAGWSRNPALTRASLITVVMTGLITIPSFLTGDPAEEIIEHMPRISEQMIHVHEEAAEIAVWLVGAAAVAALATLVMVRKRKSVPAWVVPCVAVLTFVSAILLARTNNLGGKISHPEISESQATGSGH